MQTCWIFDVDGVITDPVEKKVIEPELFNEISKRLSSHDVVALNTGRSLSWMIDRVISPLENYVADKSYFSNFIGVGEKGGAWVVYEDENWKNNIDLNISVPKELQDEIKNMITKNFSDSMFYDESKLTMISTEMLDGYNNDLYLQKQKEIVGQMRKALEKYKNLDLKIDPTQIATDIQNSRTGKHLGAKRIENWLEQNGIKPEKIFMFGDSQSYTEMVEELQERYPAEFVFVNDPSKLDTGKIKCKISYASKKFSRGTLEFLKATD